MKTTPFVILAVAAALSLSGCETITSVFQPGSSATPTPTATPTPRPAPAGTPVQPTPPPNATPPQTTPSPSPTEATASDAPSTGTPAPVAGEGGAGSADSGLPFATPVPGKAGYVVSPYAPQRGYVDVRGFSPGSEAKCPYTSKVFLVP